MTQALSDASDQEEDKTIDKGDIGDAQEDGRLFFKCATCGETFVKDGTAEARKAFSWHIMINRHQSGGTIDALGNVIEPPKLSPEQRRKRGLDAGSDTQGKAHEKASAPAKEAGQQISPGESIAGFVGDVPPGGPGGMTETEEGDFLIHGFGIPVRVLLNTITLTRYQVMRARIPDMTLGDFLDACAEESFRGRGMDIGIINIRGQHGRSEQASRG